MPEISAFDRATAVPGMLFFGTISVVVSKMLFNMTAINSDGEPAEFKKPYWQVLMMFVGMCSCLVVHEINKCSETNKSKNEKKPLISSKGAADNETEKEMTFWEARKDYFVILIPAMFDLVATALMYTGFMFVPASVFQLLRGSMVLFSAILSRIFLKKVLQNFHITGIAIIMCALIAVGVATLKSPDADAGKVHTPEEQMIGIVLIVGAQLVQASQIVVESYLLENNQLPATLIVGMEGLWGTIVSAVLVLPVMEMIPQAEHTGDTFVMLENNHALIWATGLYIIAILFYNLFGMRVTQQYSAVHRTILEAVRTACIWLVDLALYYWITNNKQGEKWTVWSWCELFGFALLLIGTFIYNQVIRI